MKKLLLLTIFAFVAFGLKAQTTNTTKDRLRTGPIYTAVEIEPVYPGGMAVLNKYMADHIRYPAKEKAEGIQGKAILQFVVEKDGSLDDIKVLRAPTEGLGKEAVRVVSTAPNWIPGMQNGKKNVYSLPLL